MYEKTKIKIPLPRLPSPGRLRQLLPCIVRFGCAFFFTSASLGGHYLPLGLCLLTVPGPGLFGLSALLGLCFAAILLWDLSVAAELIAAAVLIRAAVWIFRETPPMEHVLFLPLASALVSALTGGVMLMSEQANNSHFLFYLLRIAISFFGSWLLRHIAAEPTKEGILFLIGCLVLSARTVLPAQFSLGIFLAALLTVCTSGNPSGLVIAAVCGIAMDLGSSHFPMTALLTLASLLSSLTATRSSNVARAVCALVILIGTLLTEQHPLLLFLPALLGVLPALILPNGLIPSLPSTNPRPAPPVRHMFQAARLLSDLNTRLLRELPEPPAPDPSLIFDRAADRVCKSCPQFSVCWSGSCEAYDALSGAARPMLARGAVLRDDFPISFLARCRRVESLLLSINQELDGVLFRRQFRHRLNESRSLLAEQYRIFSTYLQTTAQRLSSSTRIRPICMPILGTATAERQGSFICGDRGTSFRTFRHLHYILLCDGMGSGYDAMAESSASVRMLQELLISGFRPDDALQILNSVYLMRDDGAFSTVDLLEADLSTGTLTLWKWGSAPTYLKHGSTVKRIGTALPPPGLEGTGKAERFQLSLDTGDLLVLLSDGAACTGTEEQIRTYSGSSPKELAANIISQCRGEDDDRTAVVLKLQYIASHRQHTTNCV